MGDFVRDNAAAVLGAVVALLVAAVTVATAEGGRHRRALRLVKEELEVAELLVAHEHFSDEGERLRDQVRRRLENYLLTPRARWNRWAERVAVVMTLAGLLFSLVDLWNAVQNGEPLSWFTTSFIAALVIALGFLVVAAAIGFAVTWILRPNVRRLQKRVDAVGDRIDRLEELDLEQQSR